MSVIHDVEGAKTYLVEHKLHTLFEGLAADVIAKRPENPYPFLMERIRAAEDEAMAVAGKQSSKVYFVLGGPGSGKGTQCAMLVEQLGFLHVSAGDLLREEVSSGSEEGNAIADDIKNGRIVPGHITIGLLRKWIARQPTGSSILVDGFPREMRQALDFERNVRPCTGVLFFDVPDDVLTRRLLERGKTSGRSDDNDEAIKKRLVTFHTQTMAVMEYFRAQDRVLEVSAVDDKDTVFELAKKALRI